MRRYLTYMLCIMLCGIFQIREIKATTIDPFMWEQLVLDADFVGIIECTTAGGIVAKYRVIESWKGIPPGTDISLRITVNYWEPQFPIALYGERFLVTAFKSHVPSRIVSTTVGSGVPLWWREIPSDYTLPLFQGRVLLPLHAGDKPLISLGSEHPDLETFKAAVQELLASSPEQQEFFVLRRVAEKYLRKSQSSAAFELQDCPFADEKDLLETELQHLNIFADEVQNATSVQKLVASFLKFAHQVPTEFSEGDRLLRYIGHLRRDLEYSIEDEEFIGLQNVLDETIIAQIKQNNRRSQDLSGESKAAIDSQTRRLNRLLQEMQDFGKPSYCLDFLVEFLQEDQSEYAALSILHERLRQPLASYVGEEEFQLLREEMLEEILSQQDRVDYKLTYCFSERRTRVERCIRNLAGLSEKFYQGIHSIEDLVRTLIDFANQTQGQRCSSVAGVTFGQAAGAHTLRILESLPDGVFYLSPTDHHILLASIRENISSRKNPVQYTSQSEKVRSPPSSQELQEMQEILRGNPSEEEFFKIFGTMTQYAPGAIVEYWLDQTRSEELLRDLDRGYVISSYFAWRCGEDRERYLRALLDVQNHYIQVVGAIYLTFENREAGLDALQQRINLPGDPGILAALNLARRGVKSAVPRAIEALIPLENAGGMDEVPHRNLQRRLLVLLSNSAQHSGIAQPKRLREFSYRDRQTPYEFYIDWWNAHQDDIVLYDPWLELFEKQKID